MVSVLNPPRRHFLSWDRPLLPQAVAFLAGDWRGGAPLDLSHTLVVVPTRQSGRRLREALADYASRRGSAAFPPRVVTPESLVATETGPEVASRLDNLSAWVGVLRALDLREFRAVFPTDPPARSFTWALRLAEQFTRLEAALAEGALAIDDVVTKLSPDFPEWSRWDELAHLARLQREKLRHVGLRPLFGRDAGADTGLRGGQDVQRIVLLATPDPMSVALAIVQRNLGSRAVDVLIYANADEAENFDAWGRPLLDRWKARPLILSHFEERTHVCADPGEQAQRLSDLVKSYVDAGSAKSLDGMLALGIADPELVPLVEGELARSDAATFNPEGKQRRSGRLYHLVTALAGFSREASVDAVVAVVRCPDVLAYLAKESQVAAAEILSELDYVRQKHMPADLAGVQKHAKPRLSHALALMVDLRRTLTERRFPDNVSAVLASIFRDRWLSPSELDRELEDEAAAWMDMTAQCRQAMQRFPTLTSDDSWELALRIYGESRRSDEKPLGALDLQGWLELLFEDAPHLVVGGFNDGLVPEALTEDPFLPDSLRAHLGLKTNARRFARDAYILSAIAATRAESGRLDLLFGKTSSSGEPLRPSRLLLQCVDEELPDRVAYLFREVPSSDGHLPWSRAWRLRAPVGSAPSKIAVTALRRWLECPFRFYLKYVRRMEAVDPAKSEMDAFDFGTLCHAALEAMSREPALRDCVDAAVLRDFLWTELNRNAYGRYDADLSLPLLIQLESARQRLGKAAEIQARLRAEGWVTQAVETPLTIEINGLGVRAKIDRIDRHLTTGALRVIDYKTSDAAVTPQSAHLRPVRRTETVPEWAYCHEGDKVRVWSDLQLPLYREALAAEWGTDIACGYINLPKAISQTSLALWGDYSIELHQSAMRCAQGVCAAIRAGQFWPPNEDVRSESDEFAALFHHGAAESVEWGAGP